MTGTACQLFEGMTSFVDVLASGPDLEEDLVNGKGLVDYRKRKRVGAGHRGGSAGCRR
jgi:hypothetical protein